MTTEVNALVLGAGNFGKHYVRILSQLNGKRLGDIPRIDKLILTRTQFRTAHYLAERIGGDGRCAVNQVIPAEVHDLAHVLELLDRYNPQFICIVAKDKEHGATIHATYTTHALKHGTVLCEKPFSDATGDGASLQHFKKLSAHENSPFFGLELPFAVVLRRIMQNGPLRTVFANARSIKFYWSSTGTNPEDIINDLALHPWSLIPPQFRTDSVEVEKAENMVRIRLQLYNRQAFIKIPCEMILKAGGRFRGMMIDHLAVGLYSSGVLVRLRQLKHPLEEAAMLEEETLSGKILLEVNNPLEQNIIYSLRRAPTTGLRQTYDSQVFLEMLHGYKPSVNRTPRKHSAV